jgi:hypothetical protein
MSQRLVKTARRNGALSVLFVLGGVLTALLFPQPAQCRRPTDLFSRCHFEATALDFAVVNSTSR